MTSNVDLVKEYLEKSWSNPPASMIEANTIYLSDDYVSLDKNGNVQMDKANYIGMATMLLAAFPDMNWVLTDLRAEGDSVVMTGHFQGTHTGEVDLSAMGLGVIPASGKWIVWPEDSVEYKVEGGQITRQAPYGDSGGMEEFLAPLGIQLPSA